jgi:prevent-host-death family protein
MTTYLTVTEVKAKLNELVEETDRTLERVIITRHGKPAAILMSITDFEGLEDTAYWLSQPEILEDIEEGRREIAAGGGVDSNDLAEQHGLGKKPATKTAKKPATKTAKKPA